MNEKKLTEDQKKRIKAIETEWMTEVSKIPEKPLTKWPDISRNEPYKRLEKKYLPQIRAIYEE